MSRGRRNANPVPWLAWPALILAIISLGLPALEIRTPLFPPRQWSLYSLAFASLRAAWRHHHRRQLPTHWFHDFERLRAELGKALPGHPPVPLVFKLGALVPAAMYLALICTGLAVLLALVRRHAAMRVCALLGGLSAGYAIVISLWLTHAAQAELHAALARAGAALPLLPAWTAGLSSQLQLIPLIGLYLLLLSLLAAALAPATASRLSHVH